MKNIYKIVITIIICIIIIVLGLIITNDINNSYIIENITSIS